MFNLHSRNRHRGAALRQPGQRCAKKNIRDASGFLIRVGEQVWHGLVHKLQGREPGFSDHVGFGLHEFLACFDPIQEPGADADKLGKEIKNIVHRLIRPLQRARDFGMSLLWEWWAEQRVRGEAWLSDPHGGALPILLRRPSGLGLGATLRRFQRVEFPIFAAFSPWSTSRLCWFVHIFILILS